MFGKKAIDTQSKARVIYHSGERIAVIIDKSKNNLVTIYDKANFKSHWQYKNWSW